MGSNLNRTGSTYSKTIIRTVWRGRKTVELRGIGLLGYKGSKVDAATEII
jgi:hypothetical protein